MGVRMPTRRAKKHGTAPLMAYGSQDGQVDPGKPFLGASLRSDRSDGSWSRHLESFGCVFAVTDRLTVLQGAWMPPIPVSSLVRPRRGVRGTVAPVSKLLSPPLGLLSGGQLAPPPSGDGSLSSSRHCCTAPVVFRACRPGLRPSAGADSLAPPANLSRRA